MDLKDLELDAIKFTEPPTTSQTVSTLRTLEKFVSRMGAALVMDGSYRIGDEAPAAIFGAAVHLRAAADKFENAPNTSGLALPQPMNGPQPMPRR